VSEQTHADTTRTDLRNQYAEDPRLNPLEKQTALHLEGDSTHFEITSFRKVVFAKLLKRPTFQIKWYNVLDEDGNRKTIERRDKVASEPSLTITGVTGKVPVGAVTVGTPREKNSHAEIVKQI
jgi:hypothetical protein